ncbi:hypothetical protein Bca52824_001391 [Brassica carinata]|uniref:Uncharacterized protein n=1 Tax=Brassica carinata TaxID=52824 RepID=A0A8X7WHB2_BRACI|nr:hypothetical protein Bca52824_001391 [Brassica carinata]
MARVSLGSVSIIASKLPTILAPTRFSSMRTTGRFEFDSLETSWLVVKARTGCESPICIEISSGVLIKFAVVTMGERIEFGESLMTTLPLQTYFFLITQMKITRTIPLIKPIL